MPLNFLAMAMGVDFNVVVASKLLIVSTSTSIFSLVVIWVGDQHIELVVSNNDWSNYKHNYHNFYSHVKTRDAMLALSLSQLREEYA